MKIPASKKLLLAREQQGLTQEKAGVLIKASKGYISQIETGKRSPGRNLAKRIQKVFQIDMDQW